ncbi:MAG: long-chain-fatty-acid--CoA ligase [Actinobacteria bacterium]|nr:long-chain-fatty-acid--CoA ligase [Actinomycetota bacterium]
MIAQDFHIRPGVSAFRLIPSDLAVLFYPIGTETDPALDRLSSEPLTPTAFLRRSAHVHGQRTALVDGELRRTYRELWDRSRRLAGALRAAGVGDGDRVAVLASNSPVMLEAHYGVPLAGAVLVTLNVRLGADALAFILGNAEADVLLCDAAYEELGREAIAASGRAVRTVVEGAGYEGFLAAGEALELTPADERSPLAINYTSGTTGEPKGAVYHHRGAYLQALSMALHSGMRADSTFLWTLPMFHCNGWCFTWATTAVGATHLLLRKVDPETIWELIRREGVTHFNAAPTVLIALADHPRAAPVAGREPIRVATGGAPPSPALLARLAELGIEVTHLYGLTETFGPAVICDWLPEWDALDAGERARMKARQGVANVISLPVRVLDPDGVDVPADGETMGEVAIRGNNVMLGYHRDPEATAAAMLDGHFRTGDLGVMHPDGYLELRDRAKDVIVSGGENISSVEVEQALEAHPAVLEAAVIAVPDERWGERPGAFVVLRQGETVGAEDLIAHVRATIAGFKAPRDVHFVAELPKTSTGKVRKHALRAEAWQGHDRRIG